MAKSQLRDLHLFLIESALPVGMGVINDSKAGGIRKVIDVLSSKDPFSQFMIDGETSAKRVRDNIDQLIPGLGHPVVSVDVTVEENSSDYEINDQDSLVATLHRIDSQLDQLRNCLYSDSKNLDDK